MNRRVMLGLVAVALAGVLAAGSLGAQTAKPAAPSAGAGPIIVVETAKGTFEFETYRKRRRRCASSLVRRTSTTGRSFCHGLRLQWYWGEKTKDARTQGPVGTVERPTDRVGEPSPSEAPWAPSPAYRLSRLPTQDAGDKVGDASARRQPHRVRPVASGMDVVSRISRATWSSGCR